MLEPAQDLSVAPLGDPWAQAAFFVVVIATTIDWIFKCRSAYLSLTAARTKSVFVEQDHENLMATRELMSQMLTLQNLVNQRVSDLHQWHNVRGPDGRFVWYCGECRQWNAHIRATPPHTHMPCNTT